MRITKYRLFWIWEWEKKEAWLNEMAAKGFGLISTGVCRYEFEDITPGEYIYRLEMLRNTPTTPESQKYITFLEETGAEMVGVCKYWVYFRKRAELGAFELFSDYDSRILHLNRIQRLILSLMPLTLVTGLMNIILFHDSIANLVCGCVMLLLFTLMLFAFVRISGKKKRLKREREIYEN